MTQDQTTSWRLGLTRSDSTFCFVSSGCGDAELRRFGSLASGTASPHCLPSSWFWSYPRPFQSKWIFLGIDLPVPFTCSGTAGKLLRLEVVLLLHESSFPLITVTGSGANWRKQIPLRCASKWSSPWASVRVINQSYPVLLVFTI